MSRMTPELGHGWLERRGSGETGSCGRGRLHEELLTSITPANPWLPLGVGIETH